MEFAARRYTSRPFPAYRYVPGRDPHPTANPLGHSYVPPGHSHPKPPWRPPDRWKEDEEFLFGCDLYNHGYWWESHETWEGLWQQTDKAGTQGRFLQGLIQAAACHLKRLTNQRAGVERLRESSLRLLRSVLNDLRGDPGGADPEPTVGYMGLDLPRFLDGLARYYADPGSPGAALAPHNPADYPYIRLEFDNGSLGDD